ncbi:hypothetical protein ACQP2U_10755 [Nocardia sp. CA-084685]|uniref:hypothetical protein n=1 Tax=Nocardia sp. CA-084685 TaxID=3239970 RepID=UPI003D9931F8
MDDGEPRRTDMISRRSALPIAGDNVAAKAEATHLLHLLGHDVVDIGPLTDSWRTEPNTPAYIRPYLGEIPAMDVDAFLQWTRRTPGIPVPATHLTELVETAVRQPARRAKLPSAD